MVWKSKYSLVSSAGLTAILLIVLVLAIQNGGLWYGSQVMRFSKDKEFEKHLIHLGRSVEPSIRDASRELMAVAEQFLDERTLEPELPPESLIEESGFFEPPETIDPLTGEPITDESELTERELDRLRESLSEPADRFRAATAPMMERLLDVILMDRNGRVIYCDSEGHALVSPFDFFLIDRMQITGALGGEAGSSIAHTVDAASQIKRVYVPIFDTAADIEPGLSTEIMGVLCLTAGQTYLDELDVLGFQMGTLQLISSILVLLIGLLVYLLLRRQRRYEMQMAHQDRLSSLGTLAAGFAHEVRNPLEIISACTEDLERALTGQPSLPPDTVESCRDILEEVDRLNRLVGQFLAFARADAPPGGDQASAVGEGVDSAIAMLRHVAEKKDIRLEWREGTIGEEVRARLDASSLRQVVINLTLNAIQATPPGGTVTLGVETEGRAVRLSVRDSGPGVPAAARPKIFDPFFTTRQSGSGLGLAIAHQLVAMAGGGIECEERPEGSGARFIVTLPLIRQAGGAAAPVPEPVNS